MPRAARLTVRLDPLTVRLERVRDLATDLSRDLARADGGGTTAHQHLAEVIHRDLEVILRTLKRSKS